MSVAPDLDPAQEAALNTLRAAVQHRVSLELDIIESVTELRKLKVSWSVIGETLGMSRQAAHERYRSITVKRRRSSGGRA